MVATRDAIDTIKGYFYQFDYSILKILNSSEGSLITIEGIEDVDITDLNETTAVQCKYYAGTEYNHSVISKPIRLMLEHFSKHKDCMFSYLLYGFYLKGQEKLPKVIDLDFAKKKFFTYTKKGEEFKTHEELNLNDEELNAFLDNLTIDINAMEFEEQNKKILSELSNYFDCSMAESEYYYNNALRATRYLATRSSKEERTISKNEFLSQINNKDELFDLWYLRRRGIDEYSKKIRKLYFSQANISPFSRIFLIECDEVASEVEIKSLLTMISSKMSRLSKREKTPFCPYVYLHGLSERKLLNIKKKLRDDNIRFVDGHDFKDADFHPESICIKPNYSNKIKLKIINELGNIDKILNELKRTREIYQFYLNDPFYTNRDHRHIILPIKSIDNLYKIL